MKAPRAPAVSPHDEHAGADTVERFAAKNAISRAQAYKEIAAGRLIARKVGARTIITREDGAAWRRALPKIPVNDAANAREPSNGLPAWLSDPKPAHPSRRRSRPTRPGATGSERDTLK